MAYQIVTFKTIIFHEWNGKKELFLIMRTFFLPQGSQRYTFDLLLLLLLLLKHLRILMKFIH